MCGNTRRHALRSTRGSQWFPAFWGTSSPTPFFSVWWIFFSIFFFPPPLPHSIFFLLLILLFCLYSVRLSSFSFLSYFLSFYHIFIYLSILFILLILFIYLLFFSLVPVNQKIKTWVNVFCSCLIMVEWWLLFLTPPPHTHLIKFERWLLSYKKKKNLWKKLTEG